MNFKYTAIEIKTGKKISGTRNAETSAELMRQLKAENFLPVKIEEIRSFKAKLLKDSFIQKGRVRAKELTVFTRQIAATLSSGLLLTESLDGVLEGMENLYFRKVIYHIREEVESGADLSSGLEKYPNIFPKTYLAIVRTGEATGKLADMLKNLAGYLESSERLREKVKSAIRYPLFVLTFAIIIVGIIVIFLIPKFASLFEEFDATLPLITRIVIGISNFATHNILFMIFALISGIVFYNLFAKNYKFRFFIDELKLKIPIIGKDIIHKALIVRFCRTFSILLDAGVSLERTLNICEEVVSHAPMQEAIDKIKLHVVGGAAIADELRDQKIFPGLIARMAGAGERSGQLCEMLERTAKYYEEELEVTLQNLASILEPVLIVFVGGLVLIVVLALYLPIFQLSSIMR